ncbi:MAG: hypothetical protein SH850_21280 [Planctomycetaceae bacterium]|nr:hypothetical protein [Planctomycetaceae bacterium]
MVQKLVEATKGTDAKSRGLLDELDTLSSTLQDGKPDDMSDGEYQSSLLNAAIRTTDVARQEAEALLKANVSLRHFAALLGQYASTTDIDIGEMPE